MMMIPTYCMQHTPTFFAAGLSFQSANLSTSEPGLIDSSSASSCQALILGGVWSHSHVPSLNLRHCFSMADYATCLLQTVVLKQSLDLAGLS